jgi:hypothetical protein
VDAEGGLRERLAAEHGRAHRAQASFGHGSGQRMGGRPRARARRSISAIPALAAGLPPRRPPVARKIPPSSTGTHSTGSANSTSIRSAASHALGRPRS